MMLGLPDAVKAQYDVGTRQQAHDLLGAGAQGDEARDHGALPNSQLFELYGSTEAGWVTLLRPDEQLDQARLESAANGPARDRSAFSIRTGNEVPDGEVGELFSRTPYAFDGYWKNPEKTAEAFRGACCSVGDMARRDEDGYYHLVDRKSNMIISGGENIYPSEVESLLGAHPAVKDVAVIGIPDDKWGEAVHAVVVLHDGGRAPRTSCSPGAATGSPATSARARSRSSRSADAAHGDRQDPAPRAARQLVPRRARSARRASRTSTKPDPPRRTGASTCGR